MKRTFKHYIAFILCITMILSGLSPLGTVHISAYIDNDIIFSAANTDNAQDNNSDDSDDWNLKMINADCINGSDDSQGSSATNDIPNSTSELDTIKIAIIDSGVDFIDKVQISKRINLIPEEEGVNPLCDDTTGHGTLVAGIIAAQQTSDSELHGINDNVELISIKVLDENNQAPLGRIIEAVEVAIEQDVDIINISMGTDVYSKAFENTIKTAQDNDILVVASTGNDGVDGKVQYPAAFKDVMSVGAVDSNANISEFTSLDGKIDIVAPGESVKSTYFLDTEAISSGSSFAAPHITGIASILWGMDTSKSSDFIRELIYASANETPEGYKIADLEYAIEIYDEFEDIYNTGMNTNIIEEEFNNTNVIETTELDNIVTGCWKQDDHENAVLVTKNTPDMNNNNYTTAAIVLIKQGIRQNDISTHLKSDSNDKMKHRSWHALLYKSSNTDRCTNYLAAAKFMHQVISTTNCSTTNISSIPGLPTNILNAMKTEINAFRNSEASNIITGKGYSYNDKNLRYLYIGIMMHIIMDAYAHRAYEQNSNSIWVHLSGDNNPDNVNYIPTRYNAAKRFVKRVLENRVNVAAPANTTMFTYADVNNNVISGFKLQNLADYGVEVGLISSKTNDNSVNSHTHGYTLYTNINIVPSS